MTVPTNPNIPGLPNNQPSDNDQEAEGAGWLRLIVQSLKSLFVTPPPSDNSTTPATTEYVQTALLNAVLTPGQLPAQAGNAGKFLQTDGTNVSWQSAGSIVRVPVTASQAITPVNKANLLECSGTGIVLTPNASATLASGFFCYLSNSGADPITLTPNGAETINGRTTWPLNPGDLMLLVTDGSNLYLKRLDGVPQLGTPGAATVLNPAACSNSNEICVLSATASLVFYGGTGGKPTVSLLDGSGAKIATQTLDASFIESGFKYAVFRLDANSCVVAWSSTDTSFAYARVVSYSGSTINLGTTFQVSASTTSGAEVAIYGQSATRFTVLWRYPGNTSIAGRTLTISGTTISAVAGQTDIVASGAVTNTLNCFRAVSVSATQAVLVWSVSGGGSVFAQPFSEASGAYTSGTSETVFSGGTNSNLADACSVGANSGKVLIAAGVQAAGEIFTIDVTGTGSSAVVARSKGSPLTGCGGSAGRFYLAPVSTNTYLLAGSNTASLSFNVAPVFVRGQNASAGEGMRMSRKAQGWALGVVGANIQTIYLDGANSQYPTVAQLALGSVQ